MAAGVAIRAEECAELQVLDSNTFKDSFLGSCELDLRSIQHATPSAPLCS